MNYTDDAKPSFPLPPRSYQAPVKVEDTAKDEDRKYGTIQQETVVTGQTGETGAIPNGAMHRQHIVSTN